MHTPLIMENPDAQVQLEKELEPVGENELTGQGVMLLVEQYELAGQTIQSTLLRSVVKINCCWPTHACWLMFTYIATTGFGRYTALFGTHLVLLVPGKS